MIKDPPFLHFYVYGIPSTSDHYSNTWHLHRITFGLAITPTLVLVLALAVPLLSETKKVTAVSHSRLGPADCLTA